jgi:hypothetical protein
MPAVPQAGMQVPPADQDSYGTLASILTPEKWMKYAYTYAKETLRRKLIETETVRHLVIKFPTLDDAKRNRRTIRGVLLKGVGESRAGYEQARESSLAVRANPDNAAMRAEFIVMYPSWGSMNKDVNTTASNLHAKLLERAYAPDATKSKLKAAANKLDKDAMLQQGMVENRISAFIAPIKVIAERFAATSTGSTMLISAVGGTGKSTLVRAMLQALVSLPPEDQFTTIRVWAGPRQAAQQMYGEFVPEERIYAYKDSDLERLWRAYEPPKAELGAGDELLDDGADMLAELEEADEKHEHVLFILDDLDGAVKSGGAKVIQQLFTRGRHYNISTILVHQHITDADITPPKVRNNANFILTAGGGDMLKDAAKAASGFTPAVVRDFYTRYGMARYSFMVFDRHSENARLYLTSVEGKAVPYSAAQYSVLPYDGVFEQAMSMMPPDAAAAAGMAMGGSGGAAGGAAGGMMAGDAMDIDGELDEFDV